MSVFNRSQFGSSMRSTQSTFQTSIYATPYVLDRDVTNKHKVIKEVAKTMQFNGAIPFLRTPLEEWKTKQAGSPRRSPRGRSVPHQMAQTFTSGFAGSERSSKRHVSRKRKHQIRKEEGWLNYIKPISKFNEGVHKDQKISFERI